MLKMNGKGMEYLWVKENMIVPAQVINILGEQNVEGDVDQDRNHGDNDDEGVELTYMADKVFEDVMSFS